MVKKFLSLLAMVTCILSLHAQENDDEPIVKTSETTVAAPDLKKPALASKAGFHLSAGTSFLYSKDFGSGMSTFIAPELTYKLSPKFHVNVGIMMLNSSIPYNKYLWLQNQQSEVVKSKPTTSTLAYISGDYLINDRLSISGMVMRDLSNIQANGRNGYYPAVQAMSLRMDYKLTKNITIGAGMHMSQGNTGYYPAGSGFSPTNHFNPYFDY